MLFHETKTVHDNIIPPTPSYQRYRFNLYWRAVVNVIKRDGCVICGSIFSTYMLHSWKIFPLAVRKTSLETRKD